MFRFNKLSFLIGMIGIILFSPIQTIGQDTWCDVISRKSNVTFLGIDFTKTAFVGPSYFTDLNALEHVYVKSWNSLLSLEEQKYSLQKPLRLPKQYYKLFIDDLVQRNKSINVENQLATEPKLLALPQIESHVRSYRLQENEGVGVVYLVENMDAMASTLSVWVTFIQLSTNKLLHTERITVGVKKGKVQKRWAKGFAQLTKQIGKTYTSNWAIHACPE